MTKKPAIDKEQIADFVEFLTGDRNGSVHWQAFAEGDGKNNKLAKAWHRKKPLDAILRDLQNSQNLGMGVFAVINNTDGRGRYAANVTDLRYVFIDCDDAGYPEDWHQEPDLIVQRGPKNYHAYWKIKSQTGVPLSGKNTCHVRFWKKVQRLLALHYGTDQKITDPSRVMRVPGTSHMKDPDNILSYKIAHQVEQSEATGIADFVKGIPSTKEHRQIVKEWLSSSRKNTQGVAEGVDTDTEDNQDRYLDYLEASEPAVEGANGDTHTFSVCCKGVDFGLSATSILECILEDWNDRCSPPWDMDELTDKIDNAMRYNQNAPGCESLEAQFEPVKEETSNVVDLFGEEGDAPAKEKRKKDVEAAKAYDDAMQGDWTNELNRTPRGLLEQHVPNAMTILRGFAPLTGLFAYNQFSHNIRLIKSPPWDPARGVPADGIYIKDTDVGNCVNFIHRKFDGFPLPTNKMIEALAIVAEDQGFHPIKDDILSEKWDGTPRLDNWLYDTFGVERTAYSQAVARKFFVALVSRVFAPGCKFDNMMILEGKQGINKSRILQIIAGGPKYFTDNISSLGSKDAKSDLQGVWIVEFAELFQATKAGINLLKSFLSCSTDKFRLPYGHFTQEFPRQCVPVGTTNDSGYLKDETGNRRMWPVETTKMGDAEWIAENRSQLFAEAYPLFKKGEKLYLEDEALEQSYAEQMERHDSDSWEPSILDFLDKVDEETKKVRNTVTVNLIWQVVFGRDVVDLDGRNKKRIGQILRKYGWEYKTVRINGKPQKAFRRPT